MESQIRILRNLLTAALVGLVVLLYAVIALGGRVGDLQRQMMSSQDMAKHAMNQFQSLSRTASQVDQKLGVAMHKVDTIDERMARAQGQINASIDQQMSSAEARMRKSIPRIMDSYVREKIKQVNRDVEQRQGL